MNSWKELLAKIVKWVKDWPGLVLPLLSFVAAVVNFVIFVRNNLHLSVTISVALIFVAILAFCAHLTLGKKPPSLITGKRERYSTTLRVCGWVVLGLVLLLAAALLVLEPMRCFALIAFKGPPATIEKSKIVAFKTSHDRYISALDRTYKWEVRAHTPTQSYWEEFTVHCLDNGKVALETYHGKFLAATKGNPWEIKANSQCRLDCTEFTLFSADTETAVQCSEAFDWFDQGNAHVAFKTCHDRFITSLKGDDQDPKTWKVVAETRALSEWEVFTVVPQSGLVPVPIPTSDWITYTDGGSSLAVGSALGSTGNTIDLFYALSEDGWVGITHTLPPESLIGTKAIQFSFMGSGASNTIELKLVYAPDDQGERTKFILLWNNSTDTRGRWVTVEAPYTDFKCWVGPECDTGVSLDVGRVQEIDFAISNKLAHGDTPGSGTVSIEAIQLLK
jgi:hypothetical protein